MPVPRFSIAMHGQTANGRLCVSVRTDPAKPIGSTIHFIAESTSGPWQVSEPLELTSRTTLGQLFVRVHELYEQHAGQIGTPAPEAPKPKPSLWKRLTRLGGG